MTPQEFPTTLKISSAVGTVTEKTRRSLNQGQKYVGDDGLQPLSLEEFRASFRELGFPILPDDILERELSYYQERLYKLKQIAPNGQKVMLTVFPCDSNGRIYSKEEMKNHQYFRTLYINQDGTESIGYEAFGGPHFKLLPAEIQEQCSFVVRYQNDDLMATEEDLEALLKQVTEAYRALQRLMKVMA